MRAVKRRNISIRMRRRRLSNPTVNRLRLNSKLQKQKTEKVV